MPELSRKGRQARAAHKVEDLKKKLETYIKERYELVLQNLKDKETTRYEKAYNEGKKPIMQTEEQLSARVDWQRLLDEAIFKISSDWPGNEKHLLDTAISEWRPRFDKLVVISNRRKEIYDRDKKSNGAKEPARVHGGNTNRVPAPSMPGVLR